MTLSLFSLDHARSLDAGDPLASCRDQFAIPRRASGEEEYYFLGNSLGLQPEAARKAVMEVLDSWQQRGAKGHFEGQYPWLPYHEFVTDSAAQIVGARPDEVVVMNSLTTNLHLMMVSFYRPAGKRRKILIEDHAFPSDHYAVESQLRFHGADPQQDMLLWSPGPGESLLNEDDFDALLARHGDEIALILLPGVQYYTGQVLNMQRLTGKARARGIPIGFDLAHAAGNIPLSLHDWQMDFACWCSYKYLNSGAGSVAGCFVHQRHINNTGLPRFAGWWGHDKASRFQMENRFHPTPTAEGWQLSNPPVLSLAAVRGAYQTMIDAGGMDVLRTKSLALTSYMLTLLDQEFDGDIAIITPRHEAERGCQLSLMANFPGLDGKSAFHALEQNGVATDWRHPNVIRVAPVPLYNRFEDIYQFVRILKQCIYQAKPGG